MLMAIYLDPKKTPARTIFRMNICQFQGAHWQFKPAIHWGLEDLFPWKIGYIQGLNSFTEG